MLTMNWIGFELSLPIAAMTLSDISRTRIDDERALGSDLHRDIGTVSREQINVAGNMHCMNLAVLGCRIGRAADERWPGGHHSRLRDVPPRPGSRTLFASSGYIVSAPPIAASNGTFPAIGIFANVRILAEEMAGNHVVLAAVNLFAIVAGVQPGIRILCLPDEHGRFAQRFSQIDRIVNDRQHRDVVAMADVVFPTVAASL